MTDRTPSEKDRKPIGLMRDASIAAWAEWLGDCPGDRAERVETFFHVLSFLHGKWMGQGSPGGLEAIDVTCPACGQKPGNVCRNPLGMMTTHQARDDEAERTSDGQCGAKARSNPGGYPYVCTLPSGHGGEHGLAEPTANPTDRIRVVIEKLRYESRETIVRAILEALDDGATEEPMADASPAIQRMEELQSSVGRFKSGKSGKCRKKLWSDGARVAGYLLECMLPKGHEGPCA